MKKRILAWVLLIGFVLLLLNILVFQAYLQLSVIAYLIILFAFLLSNGKFNAGGGSQSPDQTGSNAGGTNPEDGNESEPEREDDGGEDKKR